MTTAAEHIARIRETYNEPGSLPRSDAQMSALSLCDHYEALAAATREALPWMRDADRSIITKVLGERGSMHHHGSAPCDLPGCERGSIPAPRESSG